MHKLSLMLIPLSFLLASCATRTIAVQTCPKPPPIPPELSQPPPDPTLAAKCLQEALHGTSAPNSQPSCKALADWLSSNVNGNRGN